MIPRTFPPASGWSPGGHPSNPRSTTLADRRRPGSTVLAASSVCRGHRGDGLLWFDLPSDLLRVGSDHPGWPQMLVRAVILRLVAHSESAGPLGRAQLGDPDRYVRAADVVMRKLATL
jgi:hypothetical protein